MTTENTNEKSNGWWTNTDRTETVKGKVAPVDVKKEGQVGSTPIINLGSVVRFPPRPSCPRG